MIRVCIACPDLAAIEYPATVSFNRCRADRGEVRTTVRFTHTDGEETFSRDNLWQELLFLLFCAELEHQWSTLSISNPVTAHRCTCGQQFFSDHIALKEAATTAAVFLWPGHADPALLGEFFTERR